MLAMRRRRKRWDRKKQWEKARERRRERTTLARDTKCCALKAYASAPVAVLSANCALREGGKSLDQRRRMRSVGRCALPVQILVPVR
jgi:hypothetical protein